MNLLSPRERELVALGAALASNCIPCVAYHIPKARIVGLTEAQISEAIEVADSVRQVPARAVLEAAQRAIPASDKESPSCGCGSTGPESNCP